MSIPLNPACTTNQELHTKLDDEEENSGNIDKLEGHTDDALDDRTLSNIQNFISPIELRKIDKSSVAKSQEKSFIQSRKRDSVYD